MTQIKSHIPKIRFKEFSGEWEEKKLGDISNITMGQSPDSSSYNTSGIGKYLIQGNADISKRKTNPRQWTSESTKECNEDDIIMTVRAPVGYIAKSEHNACIGRGVCSINNKSNSDKEFIYQTLLDYEPRWGKYSQGSTFTAVNSGDIRGLRLNLPQLLEQQKIASFLSSVDEKIENIKEKKKSIEEYKKGVMQKIFKQEIRFKGDNGEEFGEWEEKKLGKIFQINAGGDINKNNTSEIQNDIFKYPIFANSDKRKGLYGYSDIYKIDGESITVTGRGNLGVTTARYEKYYPIVRLLVLKPKNKVDIYFFENAINNINFFVESTGVPQLTGPQISNYKISFPSLPEQQKIADFLSGIDEKIEKVGDELERVEEFKKGLLQGMFV